MEDEVKMNAIALALHVLVGFRLSRQMVESKEECLCGMEGQ